MWFCNMWCHPTIQENVFWCATMWCYYHVGATTCGCYHHPTIYFNSNKQQKHFNKKIHKIFPCATTMWCYMWCHHFRDRSGFWSGHGDCFRPLSKGLVLLPNGGDPNWVFPKIGGFPPQIIHFNRFFHYFHHPFWGPTLFLETPNYHPLPSCSLVPAASSRLETVDRCPPGLRPHHSRARRLKETKTGWIQMSSAVSFCMRFWWILYGSIYIYGYRLNNNDII